MRGVVVQIAREGDKFVHRPVREVDFRGMHVDTAFLERWIVGPREYLYSEGQVVARGKDAMIDIDAVETVAEERAANRVADRVAEERAAEERARVADRVAGERAANRVAEERTPQPAEPVPPAEPASSIDAQLNRIASMLESFADSLARKMQDLEARLESRLDAMEGRISQLEQQGHPEPEEPKNVAAAAVNNDVVDKLVSGLVTLSTRCVESQRVQSEPPARTATDDLRQQLADLEQMRANVASDKKQTWGDRLAVLEDTVLTLDELINGVSNGHDT